MHSRVFMISDKPHVSKYSNGESWTNADLLETLNYACGGADYVRKTTGADRIDGIKWLGYASPGVDVNAEKNTFTIKDKEKYFAEKYDDFVKLIEQLRCTTLEHFIEPDVSSTGLLMSRLKTAHEDPYGFYFITDDYDCISIDRFIRNAEAGKTYYIGDVYDYHF